MDGVNCMKQVVVIDIIITGSQGFPYHCIGVMGHQANIYFEYFFNILLDHYRDSKTSALAALYSVDIAVLVNKAL